MVRVSKTLDNECSSHPAEAYYSERLTAALTGERAVPNPPWSLREDRELKKSGRPAAAKNKYALAASARAARSGSSWLARPCASILYGWMRAKGDAGAHSSPLSRSSPGRSRPCAYDSRWNVSIRKSIHLSNSMSLGSYEGPSRNCAFACGSLKSMAGGSFW